MKEPRILVAGAGGALGFEIVRALRVRNANVLATFRTPRAELIDRLEKMGATPLRLDLNDQRAADDALQGADGAVFTPILSVAAELARRLPSNLRALFFSSNNVAIDRCSPVYASLRVAERRVQEAAPNAAILRPTMIYGYPGDGNLSKLVETMRRVPILPLPGRPTALQQPVFFRDLAETAADILLSETWSADVITVAGPRPVTQRKLFRLAREASGARTIVLPFGISALAKPIGALERLGFRSPLSSQQLLRSDMDKLPQGPAMLTGTTLETGLQSLVSALDAAELGA